MLALIDEINHAMLDFAPDHIRRPHKAMMRIYRDIRFSADKSALQNPASPPGGPAPDSRKPPAPASTSSLSPTELTIAAGVYMPEREQLLAIRRHLRPIHHAELRALLAAKKLKAKLHEFEGHRLTRPPAASTRTTPPWISSSAASGASPPPSPPKPPPPHPAQRDRPPLPPRRPHRRAPQSHPSSASRNSRSSSRDRQISPEMCQNPNKTGKNRKKPVETA